MQQLLEKLPTTSINQANPHRFTTVVVGDIVKRVGYFTSVLKIPSQNVIVILRRFSDNRRKMRTILRSSRGKSRLKMVRILRRLSQNRCRMYCILRRSSKNRCRMIHILRQFFTCDRLRMNIILRRSFQNRCRMELFWV